MKYSNLNILIKGDGMLGLYGCVLLKEIGIERIFCSGSKTVRSEIIERIGAIPISDGLLDIFIDISRRFYFRIILNLFDSIQNRVHIFLSLILNS